MVEMALIVIFAAYMVSLYCAWSVGRASGIKAARRQYRAGFKVMNGGKK